MATYSNEYLTPLNNILVNSKILLHNQKEVAECIGKDNYVEVSKKYI